MIQLYLLHCLRTFLDISPARPLPPCPDEAVDSRGVVELARFHKVVPLLYHGLRGGRLEGIPEPLRGVLEAEMRSIHARNLWLAGELLRILDAFAGGSIQVLPLKGVVLAQMLYGDLALRQVVDIDILVRREEFLAARATLLSLGYRPLYPLSERQMEAHLRTIHHEVFIAERGGLRLCVELHLDVQPAGSSLRMDTEGMWRRSVTVRIGGVEIPFFSPEDLLVYLCVHGSVHLWLRLQWICDIAQLLRTVPLDWVEVWSRARAWGGWRMLMLGLLLVERVLAVEVPGRIKEAVRQERAVLRLARQGEQWLLHGRRLPPGLVERLLFRSRLEGGGYGGQALCLMRDLLRATFLPNHRDFECIRLPEPLFFLYYLLRPARLIGKYAGGMKPS